MTENFPEGAGLKLGQIYQKSIKLPIKYSACKTKKRHLKNRPEHIRGAD